jgi:transposase-like protein
MKTKEPTTLQQAIVYFSDYENCHRFMMELRWPDGKVMCPRCGSDDVQWLPNAKVFKCYQKHEKQKFSLKVGTIFEDSPIPLEKWLVAVWLVVNCKNGISSYEVHRDLGITQKSAWFMTHRIRLALQGKGIVKLGGPNSNVEVDETWIGGKARNMHDVVRRRRNVKDKGAKTMVMGVVERGGKVYAKVVPNRKKETIVEAILPAIEKGSTVHTVLDFESDKTDDFGTEIIVFIALRNRSYASGPSFISALARVLSLFELPLISVCPF